MAISETILKDLMLMQVADLNAHGGLLGKRVEPVVVDPASNWPLFADRKRHHGNVRGLDALIAEFLVERHVGVAVDRGNHGGFLARRAECLDLRDFGLPVGKAERRVVDHDVFGGNLEHVFEVGFEDLVGGARIDVVGAFEHPTLH